MKHFHLQFHFDAQLLEKWSLRRKKEVGQRTTVISQKFQNPPPRRAYIIQTTHYCHVVSASQLSNEDKEVRYLAAIHTDKFNLLWGGGSNSERQFTNTNIIQQSSALSLSPLSLFLCELQSPLSPPISTALCNSLSTVPGSQIR